MIAAFVTMIGVMAATNSSSQSKEAAALLPKVDHLVYATPDLRVCVSVRTQNNRSRTSLVGLGSTI
jgi:hypothetical protein